MFFSIQTQVQRDEYTKLLQIAGSLSNLFSDSSAPALYYRVAERVFCKAFNAEDLSRSDVSVDAKKGALGIGLKTFLANNHSSLQKVAEFNADRLEYNSLHPAELVKKVAELRNKRLVFTKNSYDIDGLLYHCVVREKGRFSLFEEQMEEVDIDAIRHVKENKGSVTFDDGKHEYSFLLSKSTLTKRFITKPTIIDFDVLILRDPLMELEHMFKNAHLHFGEPSIKATVYLPLYSTRDGSVPERSGLNQWNASGRDRHANEVYIPVPREVHRNFPHFFPDRETPFQLRLPNGKILDVKICQEEGKALMSKSNRELGEWILRDVLKLSEGQLFTDELMDSIGIDSVRIDKINDTLFEMNFSARGSYENFRDSFAR